MDKLRASLCKSHAFLRGTRPRFGCLIEVGRWEGVRRGLSADRCKLVPSEDVSHCTDWARSLSKGRGDTDCVSSSRVVSLMLPRWWCMRSFWLDEAVSALWGVTPHGVAYQMGAIRKTFITASPTLRGGYLFVSTRYKCDVRHFAFFIHQEDRSIAFG